MPKQERCTKRVVFYITPTEFKRAEKIRARFPQVRSVNAYSCAALFVQMAMDEKQSMSAASR